MAFLQFYVNHSLTRRGSVTKSDWSSAFSYDYRVQSLASLVSLVSDALLQGIDITPELIDEMCATVCSLVRYMVQKWSAGVGDADRRIPIVTVIDVQEEEVEGLVRFKIRAKITCYPSLPAGYQSSSSTSAAAAAA